MSDWIEWNGGECPIKSGKTRVEYKLKEGYVGNDVAVNLRWTDGINQCDIIAYRITEDHEPKMTREQIAAQIEALQKQLDAMPVVKRVWHGNGGFWLSNKGVNYGATHTFDIETINGVPHVHGVAMKEVEK